MKLKPWKTAWSMLSDRERKLSFLVLAVSLLGAIAQVAMIGSVMPFLSYVSGTSAAQEGALSHLREITGIEGDYNFALLLGGISVAIICSASLVLLMRSYMISRFTAMRVHSISSRLLGSYMSRPYAFFLDRNSGDIGKRILSETNEIANSFLRPAAELISSGLSAIFILGLLTYIQPVGTLAGIGCVLAIYLGIHRVSGRFLTRIGAERVEANRARFLTIGEVFGGIKDIKVSRKEQVYLNRFDNASTAALRTVWKSRVAGETPQFFIQAIFFSAVIVACLLMIDPVDFDARGEAISGLIPVLGVFAFAGQRIVPELQKVYAASSKIAFGAAALENVSEDLLPQEEVKSSARTQSFEGCISFDSVSYKYPGATAGLDRLTTRIEKGSRVGIVGGTGAGKTTFVDLLLGLLEADAGEIRIDSASLKERETLEAWRNSVAYVPQTIFLADATIAENIAFGVSPGMIDHRKVEHCAKIAQIHNFILEKTPNGYDTMTGERGVMLSGGQRQRIGIARALYRDAGLIVMDEATSALDPKTEREVMQAIDALPNEITLILIAHRLGTVRNCDKLLVLESGRLIEEGSWEDLIGSGGHFAAMVNDYAA